DMVATALQALQRSRHRRQALVLVTDGQDERSSDYTLYDRDASPAIRRALSASSRLKHAEALVYAIGVNAADPDQRADEAALRQLTDPTGGTTIIVRSDEGVLGAAERIGDELRQQYVIGFAPAHP